MFPGTLQLPPLDLPANRPIPISSCEGVHPSPMEALQWFAIPSSSYSVQCSAQMFTNVSCQERRANSSFLCIETPPFPPHYWSMTPSCMHTVVFIPAKIHFRSITCQNLHWSARDSTRDYVW